MAKIGFMQPMDPLLVSALLPKTRSIHEASAGLLFWLAILAQRVLHKICAGAQDPRSPDGRGENEKLRQGGVLL